MTEQTDIEIVEQVLQGNRNAFRDIVDRYKKPIFSLMIRLSGSPEDAEELTQETFMKAFKALKKFNTQQNFFPWLYTIGLNIARDWRRKSQTRALPEMQLADVKVHAGQYPSQEFFMTQKQDIIMVQKGLSSLPMDLREILILRFKYDLSFKEISDVFKVSVSAAKMRVHRGLKQLKKILGDEN